MGKLIILLIKIGLFLKVDWLRWICGWDKLSKKL